MINLRNVSKFYYKKGMIASGISRVNLKMDLGEFVVITGESGSGKSTLLNVISGMDTYEEGEMYVDGRETSHFSEKDFADYRKRYIGYIFQNFNLIGSYTVYQNVEIVLLINGFRRKYIKQKTREILAKVGLSEHANTRASKLSGGQKQRVAIARALARETDIIVADEPTGNLDSSSAGEIVKLLSEIARDKLVIVVTHNYEQFSEYATRKIKMHDGKIAEDVKISRRGEHAGAVSSDAVQDVGRSRKGIQTGKISASSKVKLGIRNTFNVVPKFVLLLVVFTFLITAVTSQYTSYLAQKDEAEKLGYNSYFQNFSLDRMILRKSDSTPFTGADYEAISSVFNVKSIAEYDVLLDNILFLGDDESNYITAFPASIDNFDLPLAEGRLPSSEDEVVLAISEDDTLFDDELAEKILDKTYDVDIDHMGNRAAMKVVGTAYKDDNNPLEYYSDVYMSDSLLDRILAGTYQANSDISVAAGGMEQTSEGEDAGYSICPSDKVAKGEAFVSKDLESFFDDGTAKGKELKVSVSNMYYERTGTFRISELYTEKTYKNLLGRNDYEEMAGDIFVSESDYEKLFTNDNYQATVYVSDVDKIDETKALIGEMGYEPLPLKDVLVPFGSGILSLIQVPVMIIVAIAMLFIAYFVIRLVLRSRSGYFSILRMLGLGRKAMRRIMDVELIAVSSISFAIFLGVCMLVSQGIVSISYVEGLIKYLTPVHYAVLYGVVLLMSYIISGKFSRSLFKKSAMSTYREEA